MYTNGSRKGTIRFSIQPQQNAKTVQLLGEFTNWQPVAMRKRKDGLYVSEVSLTPGPHEYKYLIDGQWTTDPDTSDWALNPFGTANSVAWVK
jgi:1,4-alpha-glucan branching enzyme